MQFLMLKDYVSALEKEGLLVECQLSAQRLEAPIAFLTCNTKELQNDALFVCKGAHFKEEYLAYALENGAVAFVSERAYPAFAGRGILVSDIRRTMAVLAPVSTDRAVDKLVKIGVTGTKGKSTTAYYMRAILDDWMRATDKPDSAVISSIDTYDGIVNIESHLTTPEPIELHHHFENAVKSGISHLVMEVSSQALKYGRVLGVNYEIACYTNIGVDHISPVEHADFEDYFAAKKKIFDQCAVGCINLDDTHGAEVLRYAEGKCRTITFGTDASADVLCRHIEKRADGIYFDVRLPDGTEDTFSITMPGLFNVSNALCAIAASVATGVPTAYIKSGLRRARASGRMQAYTSADGEITVLVDYAHNRMSFEALYESVRAEYPGAAIITVFGCPGNKAQLRRHDLGELAGQNSAHVIITEEDSGEEPFENIAADIAREVARQKCPCTVIEDRGAAIASAILEHPLGKKIILVTGKGEETRQKRGTLYIDCPSDVEYTEQYLAEYDSRVLAAAR